MEKEKSYLKTVSFVMAFMLVGKATGLLREMLAAASLGAQSPEANAFAVASLIPRAFLDIAFASAISASFIPVFNEFLENKGKKEAFSLANRFITIILGMTAVFTLASVFGAEFIVSFFPGISEETKGIAAELLKIMLPTIVLSGAAFSLTGVLQSLGEFNVPAAMSVVSNLIIIGYFLFFYKSFGVFGLAVAFLAGWSTQLLIQIPSLLKRGYVYRPDFKRNLGMRKVYVLMLPVLVSSWAAPVNLLVNTSAAGENAAALNYANQLYSVITGVFVLSIANVIFPKLSKLTAAGGAKDEFFVSLKGTVSGMLFLLLPMTVGLFILSKPVVTLFFQYGKFDEVSVEATSQALACFSAGMAGFGVLTILSRAYYAEKRGGIPLIVSVFAIAANAVLSTIFANPALASSVSLTCAALIMFFALYGKSKRVWDGAFFTGVLKMAAASLVMGAGVYAVSSMFEGLGSTKLLAAASVFASVVLGIAVYLSLARFLKIGEMETVLKVIKKGGGKV